MKYLILILLSVFLFTLAPTASAHLAGQPPFFKINGKYTNLYPVPSTSLEEFNLPQDLGAENYLVNQKLDMEMDIALLPVLPEIVNQTEFQWDFGDGSTGTGIKNSHTYTKMGSYIMTVHAKYGSDQPQLLQSTMVHILPDAAYKLPNYQISVDGKVAKDPLVDIITIPFTKKMSFAPQEVNSSSSPIISYFWDFGDVTSSTEKTPSHTFNNSIAQVFPVLRVTDSNGFIQDSFLEIQNQNYNSPNGVIKKLTTQDQNQTSVSPFKLGVGVAILVAIYGIFFIVRKVLKKKKK